MSATLKLNLGCGSKRLPGFINVDKFGDPELRWDLEIFPWPWESNSVSEVHLTHVLEHLGATTDSYLGIIKELYRICQPNALLQIVVPHPRHDDFINDPTHVRAITPANLALFSKHWNRIWIENDASNTPLGVYLDVDLEITNVVNALDEPWASKHQNRLISDAELMQASMQFNNVIKEMKIEVRVKK